jgi:uncharacterized membrane protein (GlpM family)
MSPLLLIAVKGVLGGVFVVLFAFIGEALRPKRFAGLFAAAPSVATASLLISALAKGVTTTRELAFGMLVGTAGMVAYCLAGLVTVDRLRALAGSVTAWGAWLAVSLALYFGVVRRG